MSEEHNTPKIETNARDPFTEDEIIVLMRKLLGTIEKDIFPLTAVQVAKGDRVFGASIHSMKEPWDTVCYDTNRSSTIDPLYHGETSCIHTFFKLDKHIKQFKLGNNLSNLRNSEYDLDPTQCIFLATHEPCSLCLSAISWAGFNNFLYLFTYEDSATNFEMPIDIKMLQDVFGNDGTKQNPYYHKKNSFFESHSIKWIIENKVVKDIKCKTDLLDHVRKIEKMYDGLVQEHPGCDKEKHYLYTRKELIGRSKL